MKQLLTALLLLLAVESIGQLSNTQRIQDSVIGWDAKNYYDRNYKPQVTAVGKQRDAYLNKFAEWMKQSYTPVAGLGEYQRFVSANNYSVLFSIWDVAFDRLDEQKKIRPVDETGFPRFYMAANILAGSWNIDFMCQPTEWYFTMQPNGCRTQTPLESDSKMKGRDPRIAPNAYPFVTWINDWDAVYLTPGNKLPIIPVTKGEFLQTAAKRMDYLQDSLIKEEIKKEYRKDDATRNNIISNRKKEIDQYRENIKQLLAKYANQLNEPALVSSWQFTYHDIIAGSWDLFKRGPNTMYYPVYKIDAATIEKMKGPQPVWIAVMFPYQTKNDGNKAFEMYRSVTQHLNYSYIYNYFFDPEKVKDIAYKPLDEAGLKTRLAAYNNKNNTNAATAAVKTNWGANVHYAEDFSKDAVGNEPANWYFYRPGSTGFTVTNVVGQTGNWLNLGTGRSIKPALLKAPLPKNFTLEYDVLTATPYTTRTGGAVELTITNKNLHSNNDVLGGSIDPKSAIIKIRTEAGNDADISNGNYRGILRVNISNTPEVNEENFAPGTTFTYPLKEFTDRKSTIHVMVTVSGGSLTVAVNGKVVVKPTDLKLVYGGACKLCGIPEELQFRSLLFNNVTDSRSATGVFISNIKLTKN